MIIDYFGRGLPVWFNCHRKGEYSFSGMLLVMIAIYALR